MRNRFTFAIVSFHLFMYVLHGMKIYPCAKINLGLNVVARRADGYHDLETVFYPINISDEIEISVIAGDNSRYSSSGGGRCEVEIAVAEGRVGGWFDIIGTADDNLIARAYRMLAADFELPDMKFVLRKCIPIQAGMGGGSADCAFTLRAINDIMRLGLSDDKLREYAARLGADCAFFVNPQPSYAEGIGEKLTPIDLSLKEYKIAIVKPPVAVSTKVAFSGVDVAIPIRSCRDIVMQPIETWRAELHNDFEKTVFAVHPELGVIKKRLYSLGAVYASMSGSGSAIYGIFRSVPSLDGEFRGCFKSVL